MNRLLLAVLLGSVASGRYGLAADLMLFDFTKGVEGVKFTTTEAVAASSKLADAMVLRVSSRPSQAWPGVTLPAPTGVWDVTPFGEISARVGNPGTNSVTVYCRVDNAGADGTRNCVTRSVELRPGQIATVRVPLTRAHDDRMDGKLFGMRGYPVSRGGSGSLDPSKINQLLFFVSKPPVPHEFAILEVRATGSYTAPTAWVTDADPFFPFIDTFGQYRHKSWPGKVTSISDLKARAGEEARQLGEGPPPSDWDKFGGWAAGPKLESTGFFRTQKIRGKWWLVDPEGHQFFSQGIDCVMMLDTTPVDDRDTWFEDYPGGGEPLKVFASQGFALKGYYAGKRPRCFSFAGANLARKYGSGWRKEYPAVIHRRLRSWGLNTIGNWSEESVRLMRQTPYTDAIGSGRTRNIEGSEGYWGKFPDVFDPGFAVNLLAAMEAKRGKSAGDPWCIGYFSDNEMSWGDDLSLAIAALKSGPDQPAKQAFVTGLKAKYGEIAALNQAWGTSHASWDELLSQRQAPDPAKARDDLAAFYTRTAEEYFRGVRDAIKAVAPKQLYLGCRFAWVNARAAAAAARYCDVVSYNIYSGGVGNFEFNGGADVPLIIGEFHFGALDRGMFHTGLVPVANQQARAEAYLEYVRGAIKHPQFVGCHWFQYQDEPTTGRVYDEENYQIGFVDVADTPYPEMIAASRQIAREMYR